MILSKDFYELLNFRFDYPFEANEVLNYDDPFTYDYFLSWLSTSMFLSCKSKPFIFSFVSCPEIYSWHFILSNTNEIPFFLFEVA